MSARGPSIAPRTAHSGTPGSAALSPNDSAGSPGAVTSIVTSREWVLPPRPKPGRKPSVDTPASKRKAQNRAAQRAFRERRATRVQELEYKLMEVKKEKELKEMGLVNTINKLKFENQFLLKSIELLRLDFNDFRSGRSPGSARPSPSPAHLTSGHMAHTPDNSELSQSAQHLLNFAHSPVNHSTGSPASLQYLVQQLLPAPSSDSPGTSGSSGVQLKQPRRSLAQLVQLQAKPQLQGFVQRSSAKSTPRTSPHMQTGHDVQNGQQPPDFDCGVCLKDQCLCADAGFKSEALEAIAPMPAVTLRGKRPRESTTEVDFTSEYSYKKMPDLARLMRPKKEPLEVAFDDQSPVENCGFCSDDTPCVCREAAKEAARISSNLYQPPVEAEPASEGEDELATLLPPIQAAPGLFRKASLPVMHPGPTLEIREYTALTPTSVAATESLIRTEARSGGCTGNPGACQQCQTDPMLTLFCSTVASKAAQTSEGSAAGSGAPETPQTLGASGDARGSEDPSGMNDQAASSEGAPGQPGSQVGTPGGQQLGIFIPCADAYKTLSRHKQFNLVDFSSLVGRLTTRGMLVEAQSVANLIRELDKKVYD